MIETPTLLRWRANLESLIGDRQTPRLRATDGSRREGMEEYKRGSHTV
jgi:hypothetical protein